MSRDEISDQLLTLLTAGHETTSTTLAWAVERLRRHPRIRKGLGQQPEERSPARPCRSLREQVFPWQFRPANGLGERFPAGLRRRALARLEEDEWQSGSLAEDLDQPGLPDPAPAPEHNGTPGQVSARITGRELAGR